MADESNPYQSTEVTDPRRLGHPTGGGTTAKGASGGTYYLAICTLIVSFALGIVCCVELFSARGRHLVDVLAHIIAAGSAFWLSAVAASQSNGVEQSSNRLWLVVAAIGLLVGMFGGVFRTLLGLLV